MKTFTQYIQERARLVSEYKLAKTAGQKGELTNAIKQLDIAYARTCRVDQRTLNQDIPIKHK